jgi:hypothetical protein
MTSGGVISSAGVATAGISPRAARNAAASFGELPAGIVPQDIPRAKNIEIGRES